MSRTIFHIDANSAFLSWSAAKLVREGRDDPRLIPSVVGGSEESRHGIVLAKSVPAKVYGIKTGEPLFTARQKCPHLAVVKPDYELYTGNSNAMAKILAEYTPFLQRYSVDECFLDYTGMEPFFGKPKEAADSIRERFKNELGWTVNVGIGPNKLLAKMASELQKPDKTHIMYYEDIKEKLWVLPVEELFMLGRATAKQLHNVGIHTIGELAGTDLALLIRLFKECRGRMLWSFANGYDDSPLIPNGLIPVKGFSNSTTTPKDIKSREEALKILLSLCDTVTYRLRKQFFNARVIGIDLKNTFFEHTGKQKTLDNPADSLTEIYTHITELFDGIWDGRPLRALGVRLTSLSPNFHVQQFMYTPPIIEKLRTLDLTADKIRYKYGTAAITRAAILDFSHKKITNDDELRGVTAGFLSKM